MRLQRNPYLHKIEQVPFKAVCEQAPQGKHYYNSTSVKASASFNSPFLRRYALQVTVLSLRYTASCQHTYSFVAANHWNSKANSHGLERGCTWYSFRFRPVMSVSLAFVKILLHLSLSNVFPVSISFAASTRVHNIFFLRD